MIEFPLQLRRTETRIGGADGWLLPGGEVAEWVSWLCRWMGDRADDALLMAIPRSGEDRTPVGLFVVGQLPSGSAGRAIPYQLLGGRLYVPAGAELRAPLREEEFASLFLSDVNALHPRIGLVSGDRGELLQLADLLSLPETNTGPWNRAHAGLPALPRQLRFEVIVPPSDPTSSPT